MYQVLRAILCAVIVDWCAYCNGVSGCIVHCAVYWVLMGPSEPGLKLCMTVGLWQRSYAGGSLTIVLSCQATVLTPSGKLWALQLVALMSGINQAWLLVRLAIAHSGVSNLKVVWSTERVQVCHFHFVSSVTILARRTCTALDFCSIVSRRLPTVM